MKTTRPNATDIERNSRTTETDNASRDTSVRDTSVALSLHNVRKDFGTTTAVDGISLDVPAGAFLVLLGPSGCGKTTTLRMLAGLENPTGGEIRFGDRVIARGDGSVVVPPADREAGLVFQSYALWPHKTVRANIEWPMKVAKWDKADRAKRIDHVLDMLSITNLANRYPGEISGGQQQRVAIARMIASKPTMLLFDEPLSNLDAKLRVDTRGELMRVHRSTGATSVYVTHDQVEAITMATHIALMKDGRIEQFGTPRELLEKPATAFAATFIGTPPANIIRSDVIQRRVVAFGVDCGVDVDSAPGLAHITDEVVQTMYRAQSLTITEDPHADGCISAIFADQVAMVDRWVIGVILPDDTRINIAQNSPVDLRPGDKLGVYLPSEPDAVFDNSGQLISFRERN